MQLGLLSCCVPAAAQRAGPLAAANDWSEKHAMGSLSGPQAARCALHHGPSAHTGTSHAGGCPGPRRGQLCQVIGDYSQTAWEETPLLRKLPIASVRYLVAHCGRTASGGEGTSEGARSRKHAARQPYSALVFCALHNAPADVCSRQPTLLRVRARRAPAAHAPRSWRLCARASPRLTRPLRLRLLIIMATVEALMDRIMRAHACGDPFTVLGACERAVPKGESGPAEPCCCPAALLPLRAAAPCLCGGIVGPPSRGVSHAKR